MNSRSTSTKAEKAFLEELLLKNIPAKLWLNSLVRRVAMKKSATLIATKIPAYGS